VEGALMDTFKSIGAVAVNVVANVPIFPQHPRVVRIIANRLARRVIERQMRDQWVRLPNYAEVRVLAREYLSAHSELLDQAAAVVQSCPTLRKMAEIEARELERRRRKSTVCDRSKLPVAYTDHAEGRTEKTQ
jgi:hypothetical protein